MAKFDFYPDLHHVHSKVAFFASYEQLQSQIFKNWTFRPIWFHQRDQIEADMAFMGLLLAIMLATPLPALKGAKF